MPPPSRDLDDGIPFRGGEGGRISAPLAVRIARARDQQSAAPASTRPEFGGIVRVIPRIAPTAGYKGRIAVQALGAGRGACSLTGGASSDLAAPLARYDAFP